MKRVGQLFERILERDNLRLAFHKALLELLREVLGLKRSQLALISGAASREKKFLISGLAAEENPGNVTKLQCTWLD